MTTTLDTTATSTLLGYVRVSTTHQSLDAQHDALQAAGVPESRIYSDKLSGARSDRPGLLALLDYAREGDTIVVVGIDRLGRDSAEVMATIRDLGQRGVVLRSIREGIDTGTPTGRMIAGVLASLAELELELGKERRAAAREARTARGASNGRPPKLTPDRVAALRRMRESGEPVGLVAETFGVSRATVYRLVGRPNR